MTERFYVKGSKIRNKITNEFYTVDEVCQILNKQDQLLETTGDEILELKQLLLQCNREFRRYDGRKLFTLEFVVYADILNKISEVLDPK